MASPILIKSPSKPIKIIKVIKKTEKQQQKEKTEDEEEFTIPCRLCTKSFANEVATRNHLRMEHSGEEVNLKEWVETAMKIKDVTDQKAIKNILKTEAAQKQIEKNTELLISTMEPLDIMSLARQDFSYVIIKDDDNKHVDKVVRKRKLEAEEANKKLKKEKEKERDVRPITGPFECLQPSNLVASGTCHQIFFSCCDYSIHYRDEHTRRRKAIKCQVCEKILASTPGEEVTSPFPCLVCGTGFQNNKQLSEHMTTAHTKLKPYECNICHKRFTQLGGVQQHMRMHTGDRPFACTYCDKAFTQKSGLDQHLRTHTKVKPYRCVICAKAFIQSVHLKQHMRTHTNVSPFQCVICEKRFKQSSHLNYHLKNHNEANMNDEQKEKYRQLIGMINHNIKQENCEEVIIDHEQIELEQAQQIIVEDNDDPVTISNLSDIVAEQVSPPNGYMLSDNGDETWTVQLVN